MTLAYTENSCSWGLTDWITPYTLEMRFELADSLAQGDFPLTTKLIGEIVNIDPDAEFECDLKVIILGLGASHD